MFVAADERDALKARTTTTIPITRRRRAIIAGA
jgi:hypothetical protein